MSDSLKKNVESGFETHFIWELTRSVEPQNDEKLNRDCGIREFALYLQSKF